MKAPKSVAVLIAFLLASGLFIALAAASSRGADRPEAIQVANGRVGDHVTYTTFYKGPSDEEWIISQSWALLAKGTGAATDQSGQSRAAVEFAWQHGFWKGAMEDPPFRPEARYEYVVNTWLDQGTRDVVQTVGSFHLSRAYELDAMTWSAEGSSWRYGPDFWNGSVERYSSYYVYGDVQALVALQGHSLELGQRIPQSSIRVLDGEYALREPGARLVRLESQVADILELDGAPVAKVVSEGCIRFDVVWQEARRGVYATPWPYAEDGWLDEHELPLLHTTVPSVSDVCFTIDAWYDSTTPYPIHYEEHVTVNGSHHQSWAQSLAAIQPGGQPIEWTAGLQRPPSAAGDTTIAASATTQHYPGDGAGLRLPFSLSRATRSVETDAALSGFRQWRSQQPHAVLVGAEYASNRLNCANALHDWALSPVPTGEKPTKVWSLIYGTPEGNYFSVISAAVPGSDLIKNCERGALRGPTFGPSELAERSITLAAAERVWADRSPSKERAPTYLRWGAIWLCRENPWYMEKHVCDSGVYTVQLRPLDLQRLEVGIYEEALNRAFLYDRIELDIVTGDVEQVRQYGDRFEHLAPQPQAEMMGPRAAASRAAPFSEDGFPVLAAAGAASGLAAIGLLAYFFPLVKFHGVGALLLVPGYAKLGRSEVLENRLRSQIHSLIRTDPGISPPEIMRAVDAGWSTVVYHLRVLERNKLVSSLIDGRHRRFFPADAIDWSARGRVAALKNVRTRQVYNLIVNDPGVHMLAIADRMRLSRTAASWHLQRLRAAGLVSRDRDGHKIRYVANPEPAQLGPGMEFA